MSQQEQAQDHYAETAFRADAIPRQAPAPEKGVFGKLGSAFDVARLPWGNYIGINPTEYEYEESWFRKYNHMGEDYHDHSMINEGRWSQFVNEDISLIYRFFRFIFVILIHMFSGFGAKYLLSIVFICFLLLIISGVPFKEISWLPVNTIILCGFATLLKKAWEKYQLTFYKSNRNWSNDIAFCRRTGMVKTFRGKFPFYEFDAFIEMSADMKGGQYHTLKVRHRYPQHSKHPSPGVKHPLEFSFVTGGSIAERYALWDMLSRYMDVSQPLPDIPQLEPFRHLDPTTKAFDEAGKRGRPATYWRDLYAKTSEKELKELREEHRKVVDAAPWGSRPDLMAQSVPGYGDSYTAEPKDVNAYGRFPSKSDGFVERPEPTPTEPPQNASSQNDGPR